MAEVAAAAGLGGGDNSELEALLRIRRDYARRAAAAGGEDGDYGGGEYDDDGGGDYPYAEGGGGGYPPRPDSRPGMYGLGGEGGGDSDGGGSDLSSAR